MKRATLVLVGLALLLTIQLVGADTKDTRTLTGRWVWHHQDNNGDLEAVFTANGQGKWDVAFHFEFRGKPHVYTGTAEGSLSDGELKGTVLNENKKRTFTFRGMVEDGKFRGTHAEITSGREQATGTLTLSG